MTTTSTPTVVFVQAKPSWGVVFSADVTREALRSVSA
jgi:hypothetical protein